MSIAERTTLRRAVRVVAIVLGTIVCAELLLPPPRVAADPSVCVDLTGPTVVVESDVQRLTLCAEPRSAEAFAVRLGHNGIDKREEGDGRTPTGTYALDPPRPSQSGFGTFVPVRYPTPDQAAAGYTGSAIGIHGPHRLMRPIWASSLVQWALEVWRPNTTLGCIGLDTDEAMDTIADWLREHPDASLIVTP